MSDSAEEGKVRNVSYCPLHVVDRAAMLKIFHRLFRLEFLLNLLSDLTTAYGVRGCELPLSHHPAPR